MPEDAAPAATSRPLSARKARLCEISDRWAPERDAFVAKNQAFHDDDRRFLRFLIPEGLRVLEIGCGTGGLLAALKPAKGFGIDISEPMVARARAAHPGLDFVVGDIEDSATIEALAGPFDAIVIADAIGMLDDCQATFASLRPLCHADTRLVVAYHNYLWEPVLRLAEALKLRMPEPLTNWLRPADIANLLELADFEAVRTEWRQLIPKRLLGIGTLINRFIATLPLIRKLCLRHYLVARPRPMGERENLSASVVVPCRNERGNIASIVARIPRFCDDLEIVFVEGGSSDGTWDEIVRVKADNPGRDIKLFKQGGKGKGDAVRNGFANARGDVLMILDADMTVAPEELPKFYAPLATGRGEFVNGTRLVYPLERDSMRLLNRVANHTFSALFTWLLNQRFTDTLCGTKALRRRHYERIAAGRAYFGDFDPFGDFDLIFGAAKLSLKVVEVPIRYAARTYGATNISRFRHGWLLVRMVGFAFWKLKALP
ncbi:MAG: glycosyltransferase [Alphaproteobacteria bacterium]|nr:glycosyltransferase [Alphaproteobacteria bacterium]